MCVGLPIMISLGTLLNSFILSVRMRAYLLFWGDFDLIRNNKERNNGQGDPKLMDMFNSFIGDL